MNEARSYAIKVCDQLRAEPGGLAAPALVTKSWADTVTPIIEMALPLANSAALREARWEALRRALIATRDDIAAFQQAVEAITNPTTFVPGREQAASLSEASAPVARDFQRLVDECALAAAD